MLWNWVDQSYSELKHLQGKLEIQKPQPSDEKPKNPQALKEHPRSTDIFMCCQNVSFVTEKQEIMLKRKVEEMLLTIIRPLENKNWCIKPEHQVRKAGTRAGWPTHLGIHSSVLQYLQYFKVKWLRRWTYSVYDLHCQKDRTWEAEWFTPPMPKTWL